MTEEQMGGTEPETTATAAAAEPAEETVATIVADAPAATAEAPEAPAETPAAVDAPPALTAEETADAPELITAGLFDENWRWVKEPEE